MMGGREEREACEGRWLDHLQCNDRIQHIQCAIMKSCDATSQMSVIGSIKLCGQMFLMALWVCFLGKCPCQFKRGFSAARSKLSDS